MRNYFYIQVILVLLLLFPYYLFNVFFSSSDLETTATVPQIIKTWEYPVESHEIITEDGYILTLYRITHGVNSSTHSGCARPPIIMDHSLFSDSSQYVLNPPNSSPAMILADAGFDVFLVNHRGSKYSKTHRDFDTNDARYWKFTIDEYAKYDLPAVINHVLKVTDEKSLYWIGHSQGAVLPMLLLSEQPEYNDKIRTLFQLTPPGTGYHAKGFWNFVFIGHRILMTIYKFLPFSLGSYEAVGTGIRAQIQLVTGIFCGVPLLKPFCHHGLHFGCGRPTDSFNHSLVPLYSSHLPTSTSTWNMLHWAQIATRKKLEHFDVDKNENMARYGQAIAPPYNLSKVNVPVHIFFSSSDFLVPREDIYENILPLLRKEIVKGVYDVSEYNHIDFTFASDLAEKVFNRVISLVKQQEENMCDK